MYTDDTSIHHSSKDITQFNAVLNEELRRLDTLLKGNKLSFNVAKTRSMLITTKQKKKYLTAVGTSAVKLAHACALEFNDVTYAPE